MPGPRMRPAPRASPVATFLLRRALLSPGVASAHRGLAIEAPAGAVWLRTPQGFLQLACQENIEKVGLGLLAFAGWRGLQAFFDVDRCGRTAQGLASRAGQANEVTMPPGASQLVLWMELDPGVRFSAYRLQIRNQAGSTLETV